MGRVGLSLMRFENQKRHAFSLDRECFRTHYEAADDLVGMNLNLEMEMSEPELCASLQECQKSKTVRFAGTWRLAPGRAMSLWPRRTSQILIVQGSAWITWSGTLSLAGLSGSDHFLQAGQMMDVPAGAHLVMEPRHSDQGVHFDWRELPKTLELRAPGEHAVAELMRAWWLAWTRLGGATVQLMRGLAGCWLSGRRTSRLTA
jgi:hypothetical protein